VATRSERPLTGVSVVVTRDEGSDGALSTLLRALGATVLVWPTIRSAPPADPRPLTTAVEGLDGYDWVAFTSPRAVEAVAGVRRDLPPGVRVAAVGEATAGAAAAAGWAVDVVPDSQTAVALVAALRAAGLGEGDRVLFPASEIAHATLEAGVKGLGAEVVRVTAYRTVPAPLDRAACAGALDSGGVDVISFTSPSALENLRSGLGEALFDRAARDVVMAAIGPTTAAAVRAAGAARLIEATEHSLEGLAERIAEWGRQHRTTGAS
jgi:uroporphyrinogen-III synthase